MLHVWIIYECNSIWRKKTKLKYFFPPWFFREIELQKLLFINHNSISRENTGVCRMRCIWWETLKIYFILTHNDHNLLLCVEGLHLEKKWIILYYWTYVCNVMNYILPSLSSRLIFAPSFKSILAIDWRFFEQA